jgi:hypothetical protein
LYAGGEFTNIGSQARNRIAALDISTGLASVWDPNSNGAVLALALNSGLLYVGGSFTNIGGQSRNRLAAIDRVTGLATTWDPRLKTNAGSTAIYTLNVFGEKVFVGGRRFDRIGEFGVGLMGTLSASTGQPQ